MATRASEELLAAPLPELIEGLGRAVVNANKELRQGDMIYTIDEAEIELKVALSVNTSSEFKAGAEFGLQAFSVNASYSKMYGFKEEASSTIKLKVKAVPLRTPKAISQENPKPEVTKTDTQ